MRGKKKTSKIHHDDIFEIFPIRCDRYLIFHLTTFQKQNSHSLKIFYLFNPVESGFPRLMKIFIDVTI